MKILDDNKRLFGMLNPVDLVAILLAIALVAVLGIVLLGRGPSAPVVSSRDSDTIELVLEGTMGLLDDPQFEEGQEISRIGGLGLLGTVESIKIGPAEREVFDAEGKPIIANSPTSRKVTIVVKGTGLITESAASIGTEKIRQNQVFEAQFPYFQIPVRVLSIKKVD